MKSVLTALLGLTFLWPVYSGAVTYNFICGTNNNAGDCATSESYLSLEVLSTTLGASFELTNVGPLQTHTKTFWIDDDSSLLNISSAVKTQSAGVSYTNLVASTQNVGGLPSFVAEAESNVSGNAAKGVTSGPNALANPEFLKFDIGLTSTFNALIAALDGGALRVGIHVGSYASGGSEKLYTSPIPVPAAVWLFGTALIGFIGFSRRTSV